MNGNKPYYIFSIVAYIVSVILSKIFKFSLHNTWQAFVVLVMVFGPLWVLGWKTSNKYKKKHSFICGIAKFYLVLILLGYLIFVGLFIFNPGLFK